MKSLEELDKLSVKICEMLQVGTHKGAVVVPETLQQIVAWKVYGNLMVAVISALLLFCLFAAYRKLWGWAATLKESSDMDDMYFVRIIGGIVVGVLSAFPFGFFCIALMFLVKAITAPNLVIIEQLGGLVK